MKSLLLWVLMLLGSAFPMFSHAATLYMDPNTAEINRGDVVSVALRLDTDEGECVNTIDATIEYSENIQPIDTSRGGSVMSLWLEEPKIDKANNTITFAGGIPNGYCGRIIGDPRLTNTVLEIVFRSPGLQIGTSDNGNVAKVNFGDSTRVLLNDGFGTDATLKTFGSEITLNKTLGGQQDEWSDKVNEDDISPESFSINLEKSTNAFGNKYFVVFNTTDKQSGIDYYEVIEEPMEEMNLFHFGAADAPWIKTKSPYVLKDQSLNSTIRVRAIDKAGNEYVATLVPDKSIRSTSTQSKVMIAVFITLFVLLVIAGGVFAWFIRGRRYIESEEDDKYEE